MCCAYILLYCIPSHVCGKNYVSSLNCVVWILISKLLLSELGFCVKETLPPPSNLTDKQSLCCPLHPTAPKSTIKPPSFVSYHLTNPPVNLQQPQV